MPVLQHYRVKMELVLYYTSNDQFFMKIALVGYGKMGKAIEQMAIERGHEIVLKIDRNNTELFSDIQNTDVVIEMTGPESAPANILTCLEMGVPVVSGSTGWIDHFQNIIERCKSVDGSFLYASNFSVGVNIFFQLNEILASWMQAHPDYIPMIEETHHTEKKDAPSGTAITLAEGILKSYPGLSGWNKGGDNNSDQLAIISHRIDPAPGTHAICYNSNIDSIEITHTAHNRKGFALGAVLAAEFIVDKRGVFSMKDVLKLN
jgi:4-hydroxy-tetrahydrodipicolinate reductase